MSPHPPVDALWPSDTRTHEHFCDTRAELTEIHLWVRKSTHGTEAVGRGGVAMLLPMKKLGCGGWLYAVFQGLGLPGRRRL